MIFQLLDLLRLLLTLYLLIGLIVPRYLLPGTKPKRWKIVSVFFIGLLLIAITEESIERFIERGVMKDPRSIRHSTSDIEVMLPYRLNVSRDTLYSMTNEILMSTFTIKGFTDYTDKYEIEWIDATYHVDDYYYKTFHVDSAKDNIERNLYGPHSFTIEKITLDTLDGYPVIRYEGKKEKKFVKALLIQLDNQAYTLIGKASYRRNKDFDKAEKSIHIKKSPKRILPPRKLKVVPQA